MFNPPFYKRGLRKIHFKKTITTGNNQLQQALPLPVMVAMF